MDTQYISSRECTSPMLIFLLVVSAIGNTGAHSIATGNEVDCVDPSDDMLELQYVHLISHSDVHESFTQVGPLRHLIENRTEEDGTAGRKIMEIRSERPARAQRSFCQWDEKDRRSDALYPRVIRTAELRTNSNDYGCVPLNVYIRVLEKTTEREHNSESCKYVPAWYKQTVAFIATIK